MRVSLRRASHLATVALLGLSCGAPVASVAESAPAPPQVAATGIESGAASRTELAFFYVPQHAAGTWLLNDFDNSNGFPGTPASDNVQTQYRQDLATMAALGATTIKIGYEASSAVPNQGITHEGPLTFLPNQGATRNSANLQRAISNLKQAIALARAKGMSVVVDFLMNSQTYLRGPNGFYPASTPNWFQYSYAAFGGQGIGRMSEDLAWWVTETISQLEASGAGASVRSYSIMTESSYAPENAPLTSAVTRLVLSRAPVDHRRLGMTVAPAVGNLAETMALQQADIVSTNRWIGYTGVHSYPAAGVNPIGNWADAKRNLDRIFQETQKEVGEFGVEFCDVGRDERRQAQLLSEGLNEASRLGFARFFNWGLWDYGPNPANCGSKWGLGFSASAPRDAYGVASEWRSALSGGDFEAHANGWVSGSAAGSTPPTRLGPWPADAATNDWYLRHQSSSPTSWLCSPAFPVGGNALAVAGYIRSTGAVTMSIHTRTPQGWSFEQNLPTPSLQLADGPWGWKSISKLTDGQVLALRPGSTEAILCFVAQRDTSTYPTYIDVDALSASGIHGATVQVPPVSDVVQCGGANVSQRGECHPVESQKRCAPEARSATGYAWTADESC